MGQFGDLSPIDTALGYVLFEQAAGSGWKQLAGLAIAIPAGATCALITALTDVRWCMSPATVAASPSITGMTLGSGCQLACQDRLQLDSLSIFLDGSATNFLVQFFDGPVGVLPAVNQSSLG